MTTVPLEELRDVSAPEFARIVGGMGLKRARQLLASGEVPTAYRTSEHGEYRVALHGIVEWQRNRGAQQGVKVVRS